LGVARRVDAAAEVNVHAGVEPALAPVGPERGRPFIKWAGGKRQLLQELLPHVPKLDSSSRYFEPFIGGGALFFHLQPQKAVIADLNLRLIRTYKGVRNSIDEVIRLLKDYRAQHNEKFFYELREVDIDARTDAEIAAWFIYLNKTGFNGLYRVNRRNRFNVPFGRYGDNPAIFDERTLRACSRALARVDEPLELDFEVVVAKAKRGDFVYFDPPYDPLSATSSFTSYTKNGFGRDEQTRLRDVALKLKKRGVSILLSNSSSEFVRDLYRKGFKTTDVSATRLVNSKASGRGTITELVIR
jgi:DNA adenine methylase